MRKLQGSVLSNIAALLLVVLSGTATAHPQTYSALYEFGTTNGDPLAPGFPGIIAQGRDGNLYTSAAGGVKGGGTVFRITPAGTLTALYNFFGVHGQNPYGGLTLGTDGNFYGTTLQGGSSNVGTVFRITPAGKLRVLHNFTGFDGQDPYAPPVQGANGDFYGTTGTGGEHQYGTIYKITPSGTLTTLYQFDFSPHGGGPIAPLVQGTDGNFYGSASVGGYGYGTIFRITPAGKFDAIFHLNKRSGSHIQAPLIQGKDGYLYGTALQGGTWGKGTIFKISPHPHGQITVLHEFQDTDGQTPYAGLVQGTDGNFYGTASAGGSLGYGTIYQITANGSFSVLYNFDSTTGADPQVTLLQHTNGILYGDTLQGGIDAFNCVASGCGVFYSLDAGLGPFVSFLPASGKAGKTIQFLGQGFTGTLAVSFNGTPASFTVESDTYLTATVPAGATSGPVTVTTPGGPLTSNKDFLVVP